MNEGPDLAEKPSKLSALALLGTGCVVGAALALVVGTELAPSPTTLGWLFYSVWFVWCIGLVLWVSAGGRQRRARRPSNLWLILTVAAVLRVFAFGLAPTLSDDVYRYVWDGRVVLSGADPYALAPDASELASLRDELWEVMPHKDVETVYPPLAQALFAIAAATPTPVLSWKLLVSVLDLAACWLLLQLLLGLGLDPRLSVFYAWHPLVVIEGAGMGHVDIAGTTLLLLAVTLVVGRLGGRRPGAAGVALALAVLIKLVPVVLIPLWFIVVRSWRLIAGFGITLMIGLLPVALGVGVPPGLLRYGVSWEFNGALFEPLWRLFDGLNAADKVKDVLFSLKDVGFATDPLFHYAYPQFLAKMVLAIALCFWVIGLAVRSRNVAIGTRSWLRAHSATLVAAMICTATLYPWYLIWMMPFAAAVGSLPALTLTVSVGFAYLPRLFEVEYFPWVWAMVWGPPALCWLFVRLRPGRPTEAEIEPVDHPAMPGVDSGAGETQK